MVFELLPRFADLDIQAHVNNVALLSIIEDARSRFTRALERERLTAGSRALIVSQLINYLAEVRYPDPLQIGAGVCAIGRTSWTYAEAAFQDGRCVATCEATTVIVGASGAESLPPVWRDRLERNLLKENRV